VTAINSKEKLGNILTLTHSKSVLLGTRYHYLKGECYYEIVQ